MINLITPIKPQLPGENINNNTIINMTKQTFTLIINYLKIDVGKPYINIKTYSKNNEVNVVKIVKNYLNDIKELYTIFGLDNKEQEYIINCFSKKTYKCFEDIITLYPNLNIKEIDYNRCNPSYNEDYKIYERSDVIAKYNNDQNNSISSIERKTVDPKDITKVINKTNPDKVKEKITFEYYTPDNQNGIIKLQYLTYQEHPNTFYFKTIDTIKKLFNNNYKPYYTYTKNESLQIVSSDEETFTDLKICDGGYYLWHHCKVTIKLFLYRRTEEYKKRPYKTS